MFQIDCFFLLANGASSISDPLPHPAQISMLGAPKLLPHFINQTINQLNVAFVLQKARLCREEPKAHECIKLPELSGKATSGHTIRVVLRKCSRQPRNTSKFQRSLFVSPREANCNSHVHCKISWDTYSMCRMTQRISNSICGFTTTPDAFLLHRQHNKRFRLHGTMMLLKPLAMAQVQECQIKSLAWVQNSKLILIVTKFLSNR